MNEDDTEVKKLAKKDPSKMTLSELAMLGDDSGGVKYKVDFAGPAPASWGAKCDEPIADAEWSSI